MKSFVRVRLLLFALSFTLTLAVGGCDRRPSLPAQDTVDARITPSVSLPAGDPCKWQSVVHKDPYVLASTCPGQKALGPSNAKGAVIWSHGRSVTSEDETAATPPYMESFRVNGWDTFRFDRLKDFDNLDASPPKLIDFVTQLRLQGYRKVVLAGQSFGSFESLLAAGQATNIDAVIAIAPAAYGSFTEFYGSWRLNAAKLYPLLENIKSARVMLVFFHNDDFDPGGRGERSEQILTAHNTPHVVLDQPPKLVSHWAAATTDFRDTFGQCLVDFANLATINAGDSCESMHQRAQGN